MNVNQSFTQHVYSLYLHGKVYIYIYITYTAGSDEKACNLCKHLVCFISMSYIVELTETLLLVTCKTWAL